MVAATVANKQLMLAPPAKGIGHKRRSACLQPATQTLILTS